MVFVFMWKEKTEEMCRLIRIAVIRIAIHHTFYILKSTVIYKYNGYSIRQC